MPTYYCTCGNKITYATVRPTTCPKCRAAINDPFAMLARAAAMAPIQPTVIASRGPDDDGDDDEEELPETCRRPRVTPRITVRKPNRPGRAPVDGMTMASAEIDDPSDDADAEGDHVAEPYDAHAARKLARQLVASIDPDTISVGDDSDDPPTTFADWCVTANPKAKRGSRRAH